jgi:hypothetical protein
VPDASGHVVFDVDVSAGPFTGYIAIDPLGPDGGSLGDGGPVGSAYMPTRVTYAGAPIFADYSDDYLLATYVDVSSFTFLYQLGPPDPHDGMAFVVMYDCQGNGLAGVKVAVDATLATTRSFYFLGNSPSTTAMATDSTGYAGFLNLPTGVRQFTATLAATGQPYATLTMYTLAGTLSYGPLAPPFTP